MNEQGNTFGNTFGYWLHRRRRALDLTQEALAIRVSCSPAAIKKIEADERRPSKGLAQRLAQHLALPANERAMFLQAARTPRLVDGLELAAFPIATVPVATAGNAPTHPAIAVAPAGDPKSPFVGRSSEYAQCLRLMAGLTAGSGHAVLVAGEPGIGKSRLMREVASHVRSCSLPLLITHCYEIERAIAYQPVIDLATQACQKAPQDRLCSIAPTLLAEIAALVPAMGERGLALPPLSADLPEARQARLFLALVQLFDALAQDRPLAVMVDDIQWADDASLQFLHFYARQTASRPAVFMCAYRDEELANASALASLVESLLREPHTRHLALKRLGPDDTIALLQRLDDPKMSSPDLAVRSPDFTLKPTATHSSYGRSCTRFRKTRTKVDAKSRAHQRKVPATRRATHQRCRCQTRCGTPCGPDWPACPKKTDPCSTWRRCSGGALILRLCWRLPTHPRSAFCTPWSRW